jgi:DNA ligase 1
MRHSMRFSVLCDTYLALSQTSKRLEKTALIAELLKHTPESDMAEVMMLLKGRVYAEWDKTQIGISSKLAIRAIGMASGESETRIVQAFKKNGDIGEVCQQLLSKKKQHTLASADLSVKDVVKGVRKLSTLEGAGSVELKLKTIAQLLNNASPLEARFLIRILLEDLRIGIADGTIRDAIIQWAMDMHGLRVVPADNPPKSESEAGIKTPLQEWQQAVQDAIDKSNDVAKVAVTAKHDGLAGLRKIDLTIGVPIRVMLAQKETELPAAFERVGMPAALEYKYDGFRMQIHCKDGEISIFTRRLENVTDQFPDVVAFAKKEIKGSCILDCEAVGYDPKTGKYTAFQQISQRIRRKYDIETLMKELPVEVNVFDILYYEDEPVYLRPFKERRKLVEKVVPVKPRHMKPSEFTIVSDEAAAEEFYKASLDAGNEGIMLKSLDAPYKPGSRVGFMVKMKPVLEEFDVVVVGAEWGEGKRSGWLTSFTIAIMDDDGNYVEIGRVGTGLKELEQEGGTTFEQMTRLLKDDILEEKGKEVRVKPNIVIEVKFEEIQKSPSYSSGFALRFPRFVRLRDDRRPEEISTLADVVDAFEAQRGRNK